MFILGLKFVLSNLPSTSDLPPNSSSSLIVNNEVEMNSNLSPTNILSQSETVVSDYDDIEIFDQYTNQNSDSEVDESHELYFIDSVRKWAIENNISHSSVKQLCSLYNECYDKQVLKKLPRDPRVLLFTPTRKLEFLEMSNGLYWHNGFENCLQSFFQNLDENKTISCNFNIDGIPLYRSSKAQFWPILFTIHEIKDFTPMVIGIYSGPNKPDAKLFLKSFVDELSPLLQNGLIINGHKVIIKIRCFICDAPARSMIKGGFGYFLILIYIP